MAEDKVTTEQLPDPDDPNNYLLAWKSGESFPPETRVKKSFGFVLTKACNMTCKFCIWDNFERDNSFVDIKFFEEVIKKVKKENYTSCSLIGGEVGLHPKFKEIVDILIRNEMKFTLVTNCLKWEMYKFLIEGKKINKWFGGLAVSLDGTKETHDKFRGVGSYDKVLEALEYFSERRKASHVTIKMVLRNDNYQDVGHSVEVAKKFKCDFEAFDLVVTPELRLVSPAHEYLNKFVKDNQKEINKHEKKTKTRIEFHYTLNYCDKYICPWFFNREFIIYPNGKIGFCCSGLMDNIPIADIKVDSVQEILRKKLDTALFIFNGIIPYFHAEVPMTLRDSCALCRQCMGCKR